MDWGEASAIIDGTEHRVKLFCMRSRHSGRYFVRAYPLERREMFFDGRIHAFSYFGGIFPTLVCDNLSTAVKRVLKGYRREEQEHFQHFRGYHSFQARFRNPGKGHEKGGVEGLAGYARRNFPVPLPDVQSFDELNTYLVRQCDRHSEKKLPNRKEEKNIEHYFEEEKPLLIPLPPTPFDQEKPLSAKVAKYQTVRVDRNWYSVPTDYAGTVIEAKLGCWKVKVFDGTKQIAEHPRLFLEGEWQLNPLHYLKLSKRKPGAFNEARPIPTWRQRRPHDYDEMLSQLKDSWGDQKGIDEFLSMLLLHREFPEEMVSCAIASAVKAHAWNVESVKQLILRRKDTKPVVQALSATEVPKVMDIKVEIPSFDRYNQLIPEAIQ